MMTRRYALTLVLLGASAAGLRAGEKVPPSYFGDGIPATGCGLSYLMPTPVPAEAAALCAGLPACQKDRTHVFVINGFDPYHWGNLAGLCRLAGRVGFRNVYFGKMWQPSHVVEQVCYVRERDPDARIVVVGYSAGSLDAKAVVNGLDKKAESVDLLIYIGGDRIFDVPKSRPDNVARIINISGHGYLPTGGNLFFNGTELQGATNVRLPDWHIQLPTRPVTVEHFLLGLHDVAATAPPRPEPPKPEAHPRPR